MSFLWYLCLVLHVYGAPVRGILRKLEATLLTVDWKFLHSRLRDGMTSLFGSFQPEALIYSVFLCIWDQLLTHRLLCPPVLRTFVISHHRKLLLGFFQKAGQWSSEVLRLWDWPELCSTFSVSPL